MRIAIWSLSAGLFLAGCATWPPSNWKETTEINRGAQTNQKSSPDSGQSPAGDGLGGGRGTPGR